MSDASALFAGNAGGTLPTVGITAYGSYGDDIIIGSQTGDHLAGGSGDDLILGQRGIDHIYGDSGFNVNLLNRVLTVETVNISPLPGVDPAQGIIADTLPPNPSIMADRMLVPGLDVLFGEGAGSDTDGAANPFTPDDGALSEFDDVIFGDLDPSERSALQSGESGSDTEQDHRASGVSHDRSPPCCRYCRT